MTCNEFIRNNRGINGGDNLPQEFLTSLYDNISKNEIKISTEAANNAEVSPILWSELNLQSKAPRGQMLEVTIQSKSSTCSRQGSPGRHAACMCLLHHHQISSLRLLQYWSALH